MNELRQGRKKQYKRNTCQPTNWQKDYNDYGEDAFKIYVLEKNIPPEIAYDRECYWIDYYKAANPDYGYNQRGGKKTSLKIQPGLPFRACAELREDAPVTLQKRRDKQ